MTCEINEVQSDINLYKCSLFWFYVKRRNNLIRSKTADIIGAGIDLEVYVGIGGKEFYIESQRDFDDYEREDDRTYNWRYTQAPFPKIQNILVLETRVIT